LQRFIRPRSSSVVGLDIRMNEVRLVLLRQAQSSIRLEQVDVIALPEGVVVDGKIIVADKLTATIQTLTQRFALQGHPVVLALPVQSVISKRIQLMKNQTQVNRQKEIAENLTRYFPGVTQELCYDYVVLPAVDLLRENALLVATRYEQLNDYVNVVERAGLTVKIVDVDIYALVRAVKFITANQGAWSFIGIVEVSSTTIQFVALYNDDITYHQQFNWGDHVDITTKLSGAIQLCCSKHQLKKIDKLYVFGQKEAIDQMTSALMTIVGAGLQIIDPLQSIVASTSLSTATLKIAAEKMMVCYGLALRRLPRW
jgi:Tfp pilus assembly PilM family ATPase